MSDSFRDWKSLLKQTVSDLGVHKPALDPMQVAHGIIQRILSEFAPATDWSTGNFSSGVLEIIPIHSAVASELSLNETLILESLNSHFTDELGPSFQIKRLDIHMR